MEVKRFRPEEIISKLRKAEATVRIATTATLLSSHKDSYTQQDIDSWRSSPPARFLTGGSHRKAKLFW
ncbi:MAG: hypothetical protein CL544_01460 [Alcanivorax sp.]|nr:hypothetical protein [Alcanivorax sp.]